MTAPRPVKALVSKNLLFPHGDPVEQAAAEVNWDSAFPAGIPNSSWRLSQGVKRLFDVVSATFLLILLSPLLAGIAIAIVLDSGTPVFYRWEVVGERGRRFTGYKFRTMVRGADTLKDQLAHLNEMSGPVFKMRDDPRVTRLGRLLRRFSLDELPQIWSVLLGDMSLVGPRPMFPHEFVAATPDQRRKLAVVPGITCLWQIMGRSEIDTFERWSELDLQYIRDWSLWLDITIMARTAGAVLSRRGAY